MRYRSVIIKQAGDDPSGSNAAAEYFNAKIKDFRRQFRGVTDITFFLYYFCQIYAWIQKLHLMPYNLSKIDLLKRDHHLLLDQSNHKKTYEELIKFTEEPFMYY